MRQSLLRNSIVTSLILFLTLLFSAIDSAAQIRLAWDPNTDADLAGYKVYYGTASEIYGLSIDVGNVTTCTVLGLTQGVTYYFAVTAYDSSDSESGYSNEVYGMLAPTVPETISAPNVLSGPTSGVTGSSYSYTTGGSTSSLGDPVEYQFDWKGDGTNLSLWGSAAQSNTWASPGTYNVRARARCAIHTSVISSWVGPISVTISQTTLSHTVTTNPPGLQITVDGTNYTASQTFNWVVGSSHTLSVASPQSGGSGRQYVYASWSDGRAQSHSITVPSSSATYTANFTTQYALTASVSPSGGGTVSPSGTSWRNSGQSVPVTAAPAADYSFLNWSGDLSGSTNPTSINMNGPKSVTANFSQNQYTLNVNISPSGAGTVSKSPDKSTYVYGDQITLTATANSGYAFGNWTGDVTGTTNPVTLTVNSNKTLMATFSAVTSGSLAVTPSNGLIASGTQGGPFSPPSQAYTLRNSGGASINWSASKGQNWVSLSSTNGSLGPGASAMVTISINSNANSLAVGTYGDTVTFSNTTNGSGNTSRTVGLAVGGAIQAITIATNPAGRQIMVDNNPLTAPQTFNWVVGSSHSLSVTSPQSGGSGTQYVYASWSDGGARSHSITVSTSSATYTANFTTQYALTASVSPSEGGMVSPSGTSWRNSGQSVSITATPAAGYSFLNWSGDLSSSPNPTSITMNGPKNVTANFSQSQYTLIVNISPSGTGTVSKNPDKSTYVYGDQVTLTATANSGYAFGNWTGDITGATNPVTLTVNSNKTVTASFSTPSVLAPNGGTVLPSGSSYVIQWNAPSQAVKFRLTYSTDKGATWKLIADDIENQSYNWQVPTPLANERRCLVKITGYNASGTNVWTGTSSVFTIEVVRLTSRNGGEILTSGSIRTIRWRTNGTKRPVVTVNLYYTKDGAITWALINSKPIAGNPGSYSWAVPSVAKAKNQCKVKVVLRDTGGIALGNDTSDSFFTIQP
jgi:hypothetical protein